MTDREYEFALYVVSQLTETEEHVCKHFEFDIDDYEYNLYASVYPSIKSIEWDLFKEKSGEILDKIEYPYANEQTPQEVKDIMVRFEHDLWLRGIISNLTTKDDMHTAIIHFIEKTTNRITTEIFETVINIYLSIWCDRLVIEYVTPEHTVDTKDFRMETIDSIEIDHKLIDLSNI